jgi:hypothetical protein
MIPVKESAVVVGRIKSVSPPPPIVRHAVAAERQSAVSLPAGATSQELAAYVVVEARDIDTRAIH